MFMMNFLLLQRLKLLKEHNLSSRFKIIKIKKYLYKKIKMFINTNNNLNFPKWINKVQFQKDKWTKFSIINDLKHILKVQKQFKKEWKDKKCSKSLTQFWKVFIMNQIQSIICNLNLNNFCQWRWRHWVYLWEN